MGFGPRIGASLHGARHLTMLKSLWSYYSILLALWMPYKFDLNWISPASGNKFVSAGLAAVVEMEDPRFAMVA